MDSISGQSSIGKESAMLMIHVNHLFTAPGSKSQEYRVQLPFKWSKILLVHKTSKSIKIHPHIHRTMYSLLCIHISVAYRTPLFGSLPSKMCSDRTQSLQKLYLVHMKVLKWHMIVSKAKYLDVSSRPCAFSCPTHIDLSSL